MSFIDIFFYFMMKYFIFFIRTLHHQIKQSHKMKKFIFLLTTLLITIAGLSSCSSSKNASNETYTSKHYNNKKVEMDKDKVNALVKELNKWIGTKYKFGGTTKKGVDCSGLVMQAYKNACNIKLPRSSREQHSYCTNINRKDLIKGDLVFFATGKNKKTVTHVGVYIGNGEIIHASSSKGVIVSRLSDKYYTNTYHSSGRINALIKNYKITKEDKDNIKNIDFEAIDDVIDSEIDDILNDELKQK